MRPAIPALFALCASACGFSVAASGSGGDDGGPDSGPTSCTSSTWRDPAWKSRYPLIVQSGRVTGTPGELVVPVVLTSAELKRARANGADLVFTAADGTTVLPFELDAFDASTGAVVGWVKLPMSSASDLTFYLYFDNASQAAPVPRPDPWTDYLAVWHFHDEPTGVTPSLADSTANANHATAMGFEPTDKVAGKLDSAWRFDGTNNGASLSPFIHPAQFTIEAWVRPAAITGYHTLIDNNMNRRWFGLFRYGTDLGVDYWDGADHPANVAITLNVWHHVVASYLGNQLRLYLDGTQVGNTVTLNLAAQMSPLQIGYSVAGERFNGTIDELRIRTSGLEDDEVLTSYTAQNAPDQFIKPGSLQTCR
ncbi:MAG: hypothetical protein JNL83_08605 [Myxococcales bacterium]|nr:hypothetical protein [Myxococcales bacterium]